LESTFVIGDVVRLKSGGPRMVVTDRSESGGRCECAWFAGDEFNTRAFKVAWLDYAREAKQ
jgi:uncharacterized protein YodC (DUF2158 family)